MAPFAKTPWSEIEIGNYCTDTFVGSIPYSEFEHVLIDFKEAVATSPGLPNGVGCIKVEASQPGLKRITFQVDYDNTDGSRAQFIKPFYLHENSLYWEAFQF